MQVRTSESFRFILPLLIIAAIAVAMYALVNYLADFKEAREPMIMEGGGDR